MILPFGEVRDEVLADLAGAVDSPVRVKQLPPLDLVERHQRDREKHLALLVLFAGTGVGYLGLHPTAVHARVGKDQQELVIDADRLVDLLVDLPATLDVVRREPAADTLRLEI